MFEIIPDESNAKYHANEALSRSDIDLFIQNPKKFCIYNVLGRKPQRAEKTYVKDTDYFEIGSALHMRLGEGLDEFTKHYIVKPAHIKLTLKAGKEWRKENVKGRILLDTSVGTMIESICNSVAESAVLSKIIKLSKPELSVRGKINGLKLQCKPDLLLENIQDQDILDLLGANKGDNVIIDIKTTANLAGFDHSIKYYHYYRQAVFYQYLLQHAGIPTSKFVFLAIEKQVPYDFRLIDLGPETLKKGAAELMTALTRLREFYQDPLAILNRKVELETIEIEQNLF